jgi:uncharacterized membrane protein YeiH
VLSVPVVVEVMVLMVGALSGGLHGIRRNADLMGMFILSLATSSGGGLLRDVLLGESPPVALRHPYYLLTAAAAAAVAVVLASWVRRLGRALQIVDAFLLGLWVVIGVEKALRLGLPLPSAVFLGVVTAAGGGLLRDLMSGDRPMLAQRGELHVTVAFAAALLYVVLVPLLRLSAPIGEALTIGFATALRLLAITRHWQAPGALDLREWWRARQGPPDSSRRSAGTGQARSRQSRSQSGADPGSATGTDPEVEETSPRRSPGGS